MIYNISTIEPHIVILEENDKRDDFLETMVKDYGKYNYGEFECDGKRFKAILYKKTQYRETTSMTIQLYGKTIENKTETKTKLVFEYHFKEIEEKGGK